MDYAKTPDQIESEWSERHIREWVEYQRFRQRELDQD